MRMAVIQRVNMMVILCVVCLTLFSCDVYEAARHHEVPVLHENKELVKREVRHEYMRSMGFIGTLTAIIIFIVVVAAYCVVMANITKMKARLKEIDNSTHSMNMLVNSLEENIDSMTIQINQKEHNIEIMRNYIYNHLSIASKLLAIDDKTNSVNLSEGEWLELEVFLDTTSNHFAERLHHHYPMLTIEAFRLCMLLRLGLTNRQIAAIVHIAEKSVKQRAYVLKADLPDIPNNISLRTYLEGF